MKKLPRKLILSVCSLAATAVCLTSTTYAWFAKNANAWTEEFDIRIHTDEGLEISVDGVNYYDSITKAQLKRAIALERYNLVNDEKTYAELTSEDVANYGDTKLSPVSPDANWNFFGYQTMDYPIDNYNDLIENGLYMPVNLTEKKATKSYLKFNLHFRAIPSSSDAKDSYKLVLADEAHNEGMPVSYFKGEATEITLHNELSIIPEKDLRENPLTPGLYKSSEKITVNPADAMRLGITGTEETRIYELNEGLGSSAYLNAPQGLNNPDTNPMVTYFNNTHQRANLYLRDYDTEFTETVTTLDDLYPIGKFVRTGDSYNTVTATFYVWLDGFDADYLEGVDTESISFFLNFTKVEG